MTGSGDAGGARASGRDRGRARAGAVPSVGRLLRRVFADVLRSGRVPIGDDDVQLGEIGGMPVYMARGQYEVWRHTDLIIDVVPGRGGMFSLDNGRERRFLTRSRICAVSPGKGPVAPGQPGS